VSVDERKIHDPPSPVPAVACQVNFESPAPISR
jgi:hypothetical protein